MGFYEERPHTADWQIRIWGNNLRDCLDTLAQALVDYLGAKEDQRATHRFYSFTVEGDPVDLMVQAGNEFLFLLQTHQEGVVRVRSLKKHQGIWEVGCLVKPMEGIDGEIKACTYHQAQVKEDQVMEVVLTFDL